MGTYIKIYSKMMAILDKYLAKVRVKFLNNTDFTIICNNCWAGYVYRRYGLPYLTPTVGLYFYAEDYIKLCYNLENYMKMPLQFIKYTESKYKTELERKGQCNVPIACLGDIEIIFLHYKTEKEAREKWERRAKRINYNNLIFKFSKMNCCSEEEIRAFDNLKAEKKICFLPPEESGKIKAGVPFKSALGQSEIRNDTAEYARFVNITKIINSKYVCGLQMRK